MKTLREIPCGQIVKVVKLTGEGPVKRRIMDMGITKGVDIYVRKDDQGQAERHKAFARCIYREVHTAYRRQT